MKINRNVVLITSLVVVSVFFYLLDYFIFHNVRDFVFFTIQDIAFLPIQVLLVSLVLERLLARREKEDMMHKLNMVIGVFFGEVGTSLIQQFSHFDNGFEELRGKLLVDSGWNEKAYKTAKKSLAAENYKIDSRSGNLNNLKDFLMTNRNFLLSLMENPNLLENESFSKLLLSVFHVTDELSYRNELGHLSLTDLDHLSNDIKRAYVLLIGEWLNYMNHLRKSFPYLYSLAVRMNPFNPDASPEINKTH